MARDETAQIHPTALCESESVGPRTRVWEFAHVMPGAVVGADCNVCDGVFVEGGASVGDRVVLKNGVMVWDGVTIHDDVFVGPGVTFTNDRTPRAGRWRREEPFSTTTVQSGASIGANATILCGISIGRSALVAAGATVSGNVDAHALVAGAPARRVGWVCACGNRLGDALTCECGRRYRLGEGGLVELDA